MTGSGATTWHHGLVARWWAEFNRDGPEIDFYRPFVESGQPALDAACGTGRLLIPYLAAGLDVDGCDVSPDMLALCRERAERQGVAPRLYAQAMHELELPRRYRTIVFCGGFGLGGSRDDDAEGLRRLCEHLEPGGTLVLDNEVPYADGTLWPLWMRDSQADVPRPWREPGERRVGSDGAEYALRSRIVALDPLSQHVTIEMRAWMWRDGDLVAEEEHSLELNMYFTQEVLLLLERAGFVDVELLAGYEHRPPTADDEFAVFVARKPKAS